MIDKYKIFKNIIQDDHVFKSDLEMLLNGNISTNSINTIYFMKVLDQMRDIPHVIQIIRWILKEDQIIVDKKNDNFVIVKNSKYKIELGVIPFLNYIKSQIFDKIDKHE